MVGLTNTRQSIRISLPDLVKTIRKEVEGMKRIISLLLVVVFVLGISVSTASAASSTPIFYSQQGGSWDDGVPSATLAEINESGCAITCCSMVLYPSRAKIFDERVGYERWAYADPYVTFRANGDTCYADWERIRREYGWSKVVQQSYSGWTDDDIAQDIDNELWSGRFPIGQVPGHFILFVDSISFYPDPRITQDAGSVDLAESDVSVQDVGSINLTKLASRPPAKAQVSPATPVQPGDIVPPDEDITLDSDEIGITATSDPYGMYFWIHEPWYIDGERIYFYQNVKGAKLEDVVKTVRYYK
ncbi:MAG: hypothetical protein H0Z39_11615 [Peptococcaceae bacterium]|nr:hypothetical protein [Peptococcaceae bacterium]